MGGLCFFPGEVVRTIAYVDGFNLYYGALRDTPHRWLDLVRLFELVLPRHEFITVNYYTALVSERPEAPGQLARQLTYLRALGTSPSVLVHLGKFRSHIVRMRAADPNAGASRYVRVIKTEEKGSDVNLATHLVRDAYEGAFEAAVVVTNDADLVAPIQLVSQRLNMRVGILNPHQRPSRELAAAARFTKSLRPAALARSQFSPVLHDYNGMFHRPLGW